MKPTNKKVSSNIIDILVAHLETVELQENLNDTAVTPYLDTMKKDGVKKYFGTMSKEQEDSLKLGLANIKAEAEKAKKWTQFIFGSAIPKDVNLSTFAKQSEISTGTPAEPATPATEAFFTNYKKYIPLQEAPIRTVKGRRDSSELFLVSNNEIRAYVRTLRDQRIYISGAFSGRYRNFSLGEPNPTTEEGRKLLSFAVSSLPQIKSDAVSNMSKVFNKPEELHLLEQFKANQTVLPVLLDAISFSLVDLLNQGTYSDKYGSLKQAGESLKSHNLITNLPGGMTTIMQSNPEAGADILEKLNQCMAKTNPYMVDIIKLKSASARARSGKNIYSGVINRFASTFSDMLSVIGKSVGNTHLNYDDLIIIPAEEKMDILLGSLSSEEDTATSKIPNPFTRIVTRYFGQGPDDPNKGFAVVAEVSSGIIMDIVQSPAGEEIRARIRSLDTKTAFLPADAQEYILNELRNKSIPINKDTYAEEFGRLETAVESQVNIGSGLSKSTKTQLLNVLRYLFNPSNNELATNKVLLATVPKIIYVMGSLPDLLVTDAAGIKGSGYNLHEAIEGGDEETPNYVYAKEVLASLTPANEMYIKYMSVLLDPESSNEAIKQIKTSFIQLITNLCYGIWSINHEKAGFGVMPGIVKPIKGTLQLINQATDIDIHEFVSAKKKYINAFEAEIQKKARA